MKNIRVFYLKNFRILEVKFYIYLNRRVFVMIKLRQSTSFDMTNMQPFSQTVLYQHRLFCAGSKLSSSLPA